MSQETNVIEDENLETPELTEEEKQKRKELEASMIKLAQDRANDPSEMAATAFQLYVPAYKGLVSKLSTRGLRRVLNHLILFPYEQSDIKSANETEKQIMGLCNYLIEAKFIMTMAAMNEGLEKLQAAAEKELTPEEENAIREELEKQGEK